MNVPIFLFALHNHQPVGNFPSVFEKAFRECYRPLLEELFQHPSIKYTIHFSGPLFEYMEEKERGSWDLVREMAGRRQAELLGGGFYEPVLAVIPEEDRQGQILMMSRYLEEHFGQKPRGLWLTERIWEPQLAETLNRAGIEYTLLDEEHFLQAGFQGLHAAAITEEGGRPLRLFPIDKKLRYMIPFQDLNTIRSYFREVRERGGTAILGDDGEKFGLWPGTNNLVYGEKWLRNFLNFLEEPAARTMTYSEYLDEFPAAVKVYLPPASYEEMTEWVLSAEDQEIYKNLKAGKTEKERRFLRGGYFREFFLKYTESDHFHKRMLGVSREIGRNGDETARRELYKAQSNDAIWHGIFGGLYLPHLREAGYFHLLRAEKLLPFPSSPGWISADYDLDGRPEFIFRGRTFQVFVKPSEGGAITEIDHLESPRNLTDVLTRRREAYHAAKPAEKREGKSIHDLAKEPPREAAEMFVYDTHPRRSFLDRFFSPGKARADNLGRTPEETGDFLWAEYSAQTEGDVLRLSSPGTVNTEGKAAALRIHKTLRLDDHRLSAEIEIENLENRNIRLAYGSEWNFSGRPEEVEPAEGAVLLFNRRLLFSVSPSAEIDISPIRTLSQSEKGFDVIRQGTGLMPVWAFSLAAGKKITFRVKLEKRHEP